MCIIIHKQYIPNAVMRIVIHKRIISYSYLLPEFFGFNVIGWSLLTQTETVKCLAFLSYILKDFLLLVTWLPIYNIHRSSLSPIYFVNRYSFVVQHSIGFYKKFCHFHFAPCWWRVYYIIYLCIEYICI